MTPRPRSFHGGEFLLRHRTLRRQVLASCPAGHSLVLRCHPAYATGAGMVPFPTMFWLVCPDLIRRLSGLEHDGWVRRLEERIAADRALAEAVRRDHRVYRAERWRLLAPAEKSELIRSGRARSLIDGGIGGLRNQAAVKCLHLHAAHGLAQGSALGRILAELTDLRPCRAAGRALLPRGDEGRPKGGEGPLGP